LKERLAKLKERLKLNTRRVVARKLSNRVLNSSELAATMVILRSWYRS
jgi:hypothetical protein